MACTMSTKMVVAPVAVKPFKGLAKAVKVTSKAVKVANAPKAVDMLVWTPFNNKMFETFSFLPPLTKDQIARQVDYIVANGWTPCLEFAAEEDAYIADKSNVRFGGSSSCNYYDNRYWAMWKLPMFGCRDASQVLAEVDACTRAFSKSYIRLVAFDNIAQVQVTSFLVHRPASSKEITPVSRRSVA